MIDWLENMSNWNISRKRFYGLPLPFYKCECGHLTVVGSKEELKELSTDKNLVDNIKELHRPWIDEIKIMNCKTHIQNKITHKRIKNPIIIILLLIFISSIQTLTR